MIRFACPITTTHSVARANIQHHRSMLSRIEAMDRSPSHKQLLLRWRNQQISREEQVLAQPNRLVFPTFVWFKAGENEFGLSLAGLRCNFPALARKHGVECEAAGNAMHYRNWLGSHWDF